MDKRNSRYRWLVFFSVLATYLLMASQRTAPGLITVQLMKDFNVTASTIGLLSSIQFFVYTSLQIPMGIFADRFGPNFFLIFGAALTGFGTVVYSLGTHEFVLLFARVITGIGDATIWVNMMLILAAWFHKKEFIRLVGFAGMTGSLGFLLATVPFSILIHLVGWRTAFFLLGSLLVLCSFLLYLVLIKNVNQHISAEESAVNEPRPREKTSVLIKSVFSNRQAWVLFFCHFGVVGGYVGFISSWAVPYGVNVYGLTRFEASELIMIGLIGALIGAPLASWIASRFGTIKKPYISVQLIVLFSWMLFLFSKGQPSPILLTILFFTIGFGYGASALTFAAVRQSFPLTESGVASGFANTGGFLSAVLLPLFFGYVLDYTQAISQPIQNGYFYSFSIPVLFSVLGVIACAFLTEHTRITPPSNNV